MRALSVANVPDAVDHLAVLDGCYEGQFEILAKQLAAGSKDRLFCFVLLDSFIHWHFDSEHAPGPRGLRLPTDSLPLLASCLLMQDLKEYCLVFGVALCFGFSEHRLQVLLAQLRGLLYAVLEFLHAHEYFHVEFLPTDLQCVLDVVFLAGPTQVPWIWDLPIKIIPNSC